MLGRLPRQIRLFPCRLTNGYRSSSICSLLQFLHLRRGLMDEVMDPGASTGRINTSRSRVKVSCFSRHVLCRANTGYQPKVFSETLVTTRDQSKVFSESVIYGFFVFFLFVFYWVLLWQGKIQGGVYFSSGKCNGWCHNEAYRIIILQDKVLCLVSCAMEQVWSSVTRQVCECSS